MNKIPTNSFSAPHKKFLNLKPAPRARDLSTLKMLAVEISSLSIYAGVMFGIILK